MPAGRKLPFFSKARGELVVGSVCKCGQPEQAHGSVTKQVSDRMSVRLPHDGNCCVRGSKCRRFTWAGYITASEAQRQGIVGGVVEATTSSSAV